jgi:hypothetical protein
MLDVGERGAAGAFCATAPAGQTTMREVLEAAAAASGSDARLHWAPDALLRESGLEPWTGIPLWMPEAEFPGTWRVGADAAAAAGLRPRPVAVTVADTWAWIRDGGAGELNDWGRESRPSGIPPERELELLAQLSGAD